MARITYIPNRVIDTNGIADGAALYVYQEGTTIPVSLFLDSDFATATTNPYVVTTGALVPALYTNYEGAIRLRVVADDGSVPLDEDPYNVLATASDIANTQHILSVFDYIPSTLHAGIRDGTTTTDVTSYIVAAMTAAQTVSFGEKTLIFPSGTYRVSQLALRDHSYFTLHAEGTVQIVGIDGSQVWIMGDDRFDDLGHVETFTSNFRMTGGPWLIAPLAGQTYARGLKLQNFVDCVFENVIVSGTYTPTGGTGNRIAIELELSFNNAFYNCQNGYPGAPIGADKSYGLYLGGDNCNNNRFYSYRGVGGGAGVANTIGARVDSLGNCFYGADISSVHTAFELNAARGCHFINTYHEAITKVCTITFASRGCVFTPSYADIAANGTAYDLSGAQNIGFKVLGGNHKFNATGTTGLAKGTSTFGLTYLPTIDTGGYPATAVTGTDNGSGGTDAIKGHEVSAERFTFPDIPVGSSNATTLDCYREINVTDGVGISIGGTLQTTGSVTKVTKIGRAVTISGYTQMAAAVSGTGAVKLTNLPYASDGRAAAAICMSNVAYTGNISGFVANGGTEIEVLLNGVALTETGVDADTLFDFAITYTAQS